MKWVYRAGFASSLARSARKAGRVPVLLFHRVSPVSDPFWEPLPPEAFRDILKLFARYYRFQPLENLLEGGGLDPDAAFITFDDAFQDVGDYAIPILEELDLPATIFVPSGSIDRGQPIWPSLLDRYMEAEWDHKGAALDLDGERLEWEPLKKLGKERAAGELKDRVMRRSYEYQMALRKVLEEKLDSKGIVPMDWKSLRETPSSISLGAHTVHHPYLPNTEKKDIRWEMEASKERIESMTGCSVRTFAYPFGGYDERVKEIAAEHFELAFTTQGARLMPGDQNQCSKKMELPRIDVHDRDPEEAFLRVNGFHRTLRRVFPFFI